MKISKMKEAIVLCHTPEDFAAACVELGAPERANYIRGFAKGSIQVKDGKWFGYCKDITYYKQEGYVGPYITYSKSNLMLSLKEKFSLFLKGEPEKSFIKAGIMNTDESLTDDGKALFMAYLLKKNGADFKATVVDPILAEDVKEAE